METEKIAKIVSNIFSAPIIAFFTFLILLVSQGQPNSIPLFLISIIFGTLLPIAFICYLSKKGAVPDLDVSKREARAVPFMGAIISYFIGSALLFSFGAPLIITALMICYFGNSIIMMIITLKWKISIHASGVTGPSTVLFYSLGSMGLFFILLVFPIGWLKG